MRRMRLLKDFLCVAEIALANRFKPNTKLFFGGHRIHVSVRFPEWSLTDDEKLTHYWIRVEIRWIRCAKYSRRKLSQISVKDEQRNSNFLFYVHLVRPMKVAACWCCCCWGSRDRGFVIAAQWVAICTTNHKTIWKHLELDRIIIWPLLNCEQISGGEMENH